MIKDIVKEIKKQHSYKVTPEYWGRIGAMLKRFGDEILIEAIKSVKDSEIPLTDFLNILERRCQFIAENGPMDEISELIFGEDKKETSDD